MKVLKKLKIKNFLGTKKRDIDFDLYDNPIFIVGKNTGGKTTIMRAVYFALTGEDAFFGNKKLDGLINDHADNMEIELEILNRQKNYIINISKIKGKSLNISITENGKSLVNSSLNKEAKTVLSKLFGNPTAILSTYFIFGDNKNDFVENTPMERLKIITKVSDAFQEYQNISDTAKSFIKKLELEKNKYIGQLELASKNVEELEEVIKEKNIEDAQLELNLLEKNKKILEKQITIKEEIENIEKELNEVKDINIEELKSKIKDNKTNIIFNKDIDKKIEEIKTKLNIKEKELNEIIVRKTKVDGELNSINTEINTNNKFIKPINTEFIKVESTISELENRLEKGKTLIDEKLEEGRKLKNDIEFKKNDSLKINENITKLQKELNDTDELFKHNKECPLCHNELKQSSLENYKKYIEKEIKELENKKEKIEKEIKELENKKEKVGKEYIEYSNLLKKIEKDINNKKIEEENKKTEVENKKIKEKIKTLEISKVVLIKKIEEENKKTEDINKEIQNIKVEITEENNKKKEVLTDNEVSRIEDLLKKYTKIDILVENKNKLVLELTNENKDKTLFEIKNEYSVINTKYDNINKEIITYNNNLKRIKEDKIKQENIKEQINKLNQEIKEYEDIFKLYGKEGIQKRQIQVLLAQIELETNGLVKKFFDNVAVKFDYSKKGIDLKILRRVDLNNGDFELKEDVIGNFSDAQQEVLKVLLKISFSKVVQNLNNTPLNILFLNETFNTLSVDKEPLLVEILNYYSKSYHIGFITHNHDLVENFSKDSIYHL